MTNERDCWNVYRFSCFNLVNINHLIYCNQEKTPKIKRLNQYIKWYLVICLLSKELIDNESFEGLDIAEHV